MIFDEFQRFQVIKKAFFVISKAEISTLEGPQFQLLPKLGLQNQR